MERFEITPQLLEEKPLYLAYRLVEEGKIDPWDVNIEKLLNEYLELIKHAELSDLTVPAKVVAFATFLLKKQLEILFPKPPRPKVQRKVTLKEIEEEFFQIELEEIIQSVEEGQKKVQKRVGRKKAAKKESKRKLQPPPLHRATLEEVIDYLLKLLKDLKKQQKVAFSSIASKNDYVAKLWGLLNLANEGRVELVQEKPFGEIYFFKSSVE